MEGTSSIQMDMRHGHAGYALFDIVTELAASAARSVAKGVNALVEAQRQARTRSELQQLSDHYLRDIGIERGEIDRLFR